MDRILVQKNGETLLEYCPDKERTRIGSDPAGDIALAGEGGVSWEHAELVRSGTGYVIRDLGSLAGLFVNGERVTEKELGDGDAIALGEFTLVCAGGAAAPAAEPLPPSEPEPAAGIEPLGEPAAEPLPPSEPEPAAGIEPLGEPAAEPLPPSEPEPAAGIEPLGAPAAEPEPPAAAVQGAAWDAEATAIIPRKPAAPAEAPAATPGQREPAAPDPEGTDRFEATNILRAPVTDKAQPPVVPPQPSPAEASPGPSGQDDRFAITSILKVPKKSAAAPSAPAADLEEGVIEIEVAETQFWSRKRLARAAALGTAAACAAAALAFLRSPGLLAGLLPATQISFNVLPEDAQVYVNGAQMPGAGSGVLRNIPPGRFSIKVSHYAYPSPLATEVETGLFKRVARVDVTQEGISSR